MKYVSIALNKTGPSSDVCSILSMGAIIEDTEKEVDFDNIPKFQAILGHNGLLTISPPFYERYSNDANIIIEFMEKMVYGSSTEQSDFIAEHKIVLPQELSVRFHKWIFENYGTKHPDRYKEESGVPISINVAGKNFQQVDGKFLSRIEGWDLLIKIGNNCIDPSVLYLTEEDKSLPALKDCFERAEIYGTKEENRSALTRAWKTIKLLRKKL